MALTSFMTYCEDTMFDITVAQNTVHILTGRLNKVLKDQGGLRAELMNVKLEREEVRRKIDRVRARHSGQAEAEQAQNDLLTTLHDLDVAIQRGRAKGVMVGEEEPEDPSTLYDELMETIHGNTMLDSLKDWTSLLETAGRALK
jgi:septal ring factor EnvC (AmiA/AmiB activator)